MTDVGVTAGDELEVRPPRQRRSREAWNRVLDAGVALLEEGGYEAFTIAAVCQRASVAPPAIYARASSKDALFLAVYEHGIAGLTTEQQVFDDAARWAGLPPDVLVRTAVAELVGIPLRHRPFLGAVVLISAAHAEVQRRGSRYSRLLGDQFVQVLRPAMDAVAHADPESAVRACFGSTFAATIIRVAYGPGFASLAPRTDEEFAEDMAEMAVRYLLGRLPPADRPAGADRI